MIGCKTAKFGLETFKRFYLYNTPHKLHVFKRAVVF